MLEVANRLNDYCEVQEMLTEEPASDPSDPPLTCCSFYADSKNNNDKGKYENTAGHTLRRPPEGLRLGWPRTVMEGGSLSRLTLDITVIIGQFHDGMLARARMDDRSFLYWFEVTQVLRDVYCHCYKHLLRSGTYWKGSARWRSS